MLLKPTFLCSFLRRDVFVSLQNRLCLVVVVLLCFFSIPGGSWRKNWRPFWCAVEASGKKEAFDLTDQVSHFLWHWDEDVISFKTQLTTPINPLVELRGMCS